MTRRTDEEVWARMPSRAEDLLTGDVSEEEIDRRILAGGGDPAGIDARGDALTAELFEKRRRLAWQIEARAKLDQARAIAAAMPKTALMPRAELLVRLELARRNPRYAGPVVAAFRKRTLEESTDEELAALLDDIELLSKLPGQNGEGGDPA